MRVMDLLSDPQTWLAFATLTVLEIVLGVDNIIFISIMVSKLPHARQRSARLSGLSLAMCTRIGLLYSIVWLTRLTRPLIDLGSQQLSGRDLILLAGGLFLLAKSVIEIHHALEGAARGQRPHLVAGFLLTVIQIAIIDIVFSLDSVFVAVGLAKEFAIMVAAIIAAVLVMMWVAGAIGDFVDRHPTVKMLALSFLILIGATLVAEGLHYEMPKKYLYFAMAFAAAVELINLRMRALLQSGRGQRPPGRRR
jgi:predicted tellurium resistance membrane protein TerC